MWKDFSPQLYIAPRGLITVLLFYAIPAEAIIEGFEPGILLFVIIGTSLIMTGGMIQDKRNNITEVAKTEEDEEVEEIEYFMDNMTDLNEIEGASPSTEEQEDH